MMAARQIIIIWSAKLLIEPGLMNSVRRDGQTFKMQYFYTPVQVSSKYITTVELLTRNPRRAADDSARREPEPRLQMFSSC
jgi:hypothetical protein